MIQQLLGPVVNFVGAGGFRAWSIGDWLFVKYANLAVVALVAVLFLVGICVNLPEHPVDGRQSVLENPESPEVVE